VQHLLSDADVIDRVFEHIDEETTDRGDELWREPIENYRSEERFAAEIELFKRLPMVFCPSAALPDRGSYIARHAAGTPLVVVRGDDGKVRAFRNACRHRGATVARGKGCTRTFVCGYHGWTYRLDGRLRHVPHASGFPGLELDRHGLAPVEAEERHGLVFVTQEDRVSDGALAQCPDLLAPDQVVIDDKEFVDDVNWKLTAEAGMEGYHIKPTHRKSFYPYGFDNLNVVETFGPSSRITFPFRRIESLREVPRAERRIDGMVTYAYNLFPNVLMAMLSNHTAVQISEPISPSRTRFITFRLTNRGRDASTEDMEQVRRDADFVSNTGLVEDQGVVRAIQEGLASEANSHFTYGHFEKAIVHFHRTMADLLTSERQRCSVSDR
jgi:phenylpropionate dioxygenase-like ring-hydroxylating dioxygenase large terminal subunit